MPLQFTPGQRKELSSHSVHQLAGDLKDRFTKRFQIPTNVNVDGLVFDSHGALYSELRDAHLIPLVEKVGIDIHYDNYFRPFEFPLPQIFNRGTLSLAMSDDNRPGQFQAVLNFDGLPNALIHYQTHKARSENIASVLSHISILASVPKEILAKIKKKQLHVIISQGIPPDDVHIAHNYCSFLVLKRNEITNQIEASEVITSSDKGWRQDIAEQQRIVKQSSGVFFLLDGYYPPAPGM